MNIRTAKLSYESQIKDLMKSSSGVWNKDWRENAIEIALINAEGCALVVEEGGVIIGFASFHDRGFRAYLSEMIIAESEQKKGLEWHYFKREKKSFQKEDAASWLLMSFRLLLDFMKKKWMGKLGKVKLLTKDKRLRDAADRLNLLPSGES